MSGRFNGLRVMVVDDSHSMRKIVETMLLEEGCIMECVDNGLEALIKAAQFRPSLILLDIMMPSLDGYQTCSIIKHHDVLQTCPVILLSSMDDAFNKMTGKMAGADDYVCKPFHKDTLLTAIQRAVR
ncbi:MAG: response regulator [Pseudomonadota bacterium]